MPINSPTCHMVQWGRTDSGIWGPSDGTVDSHEQLRIPWYSETEQTVGYVPLDGTVDSYTQSHLSHGAGR